MLDQTLGDKSAGERNEASICPLVSTRTSSWLPSGKGSKLRRKKEATSSEGSRTSLPLCGLL